MSRVKIETEGIAMVRKEEKSCSSFLRAHREEGLGVQRCILAKRLLRSTEIACIRRVKAAESGPTTY
jgi:hypothetical protein